jgi:hypothetical protein
MDLCNYCFAKDFRVDERIPRKEVRAFTRRDSTGDPPKLSESGTAGLPRWRGNQRPRGESNSFGRYGSDMRISYLRTSYRNAGNGPVSEWRIIRPERSPAPPLTGLFDPIEW